jgi:hypothetical protein
MSAAPTQPRELSFGKDILLIRFMRHYADGRYQIKAKTEVAIEGKVITDEHTAVPRSILLPKSIHKILADGFRDLDDLIDSTNRFPIAGLRGIVRSALEGFIPFWDAAQSKLASAREKVCDRWDEVLEWNLACWSDVPGLNYEEEIGRRLRRIKYNLDLVYAVEYDLWEPPQPAGELSVESATVRKWIDEGRSNAEKAVEQALIEFVTAPLNAFVAAAGDIIATIKNPATKVIKPATFNALRQAMQRLRSLKEISDAELLKQIDAMEDQLDKVVEGAESSLGSFTAAIKVQSVALEGAIGSVLAAAEGQIEKAGVMASFGRAGRVIELD